MGTSNMNIYVKQAKIIIDTNRDFIKTKQPIDSGVKQVRQKF